MKNNFTKYAILTTYLFSLGAVACSSNEHTHVYDVTNIKWDWTESSDQSSYSKVTATFTCDKCKEDKEGHSITVDANLSSKQTKQATCTNDGTMTWTASVSFENNVYSSSKDKTIDAYGHVWTTDKLVSDNTGHWYECSECHAIKEGTFSAHNWDNEEYKITESATYDKTGSKIRTCLDCGYIDEQVINKVIPSVEEVQDKVDIILNAYNGDGLKPYHIDFVNDAIKFYNYLPDGENGKDAIIGYNIIEAAKSYVDENYFVAISDYVKGSKADYNYCGIWDGDLEATTDETYGKVYRVNMTSDGYVDGKDPGSSWDNNGFDSIMPAVETDDVIGKNAEKISFYVYNPNSDTFRMYLLFRGWDRSRDLGSEWYNLKPGWNEITVGVPDGARSDASSRIADGTNIKDVAPEMVSIMFAGDGSQGTGGKSTDKCNRDFYVTPIYGIKSTAEHIKEVQGLLNNLSIDSSDEDVATALSEYNTLSRNARDELNITIIHNINGNKVKNMINELPSTESVSLDDVEQINKVIATYDALDTVAKTYVDNYDKVEALLTAIDQINANNVVAIIDALPSVEDVTYTDLDDVNEAVDAYNKLSEEARNYVTNFSKVDSLLAAIEAMKPERINALLATLDADNIEPCSYNVISECRELYDSLDNEDKSKVDDYTKLTTIEEKYAQYFGVVSNANDYTYYDFDGYNGTNKQDMNIANDSTYGNVAILTSEVVAYGVSVKINKYADLSNYEKVIFYAYVEQSNVRFSLCKTWWGQAYDLNNQQKTNIDLSSFGAEGIIDSGKWLKFEMPADDYKAYFDGTINNNQSVFVFFKQNSAFNAKISSVYGVTSQYCADKVSTQINNLKSPEELSFVDIKAVTNAYDAYSALSNAAKDLVDSALVTKLNECKATMDTDFADYGYVASATTIRAANSYITSIDLTEGFDDTYGNYVTLSNAQYLTADSDWPDFYYKVSVDLSQYSKLKLYIYNPGEITEDWRTFMVFRFANWNPGNQNHTTMQLGWNEITIDLTDGYFTNDNGSCNLINAFFGLWHNDKAKSVDGWKITDIYGIK